MTLILMKQRPYQTSFALRKKLFYKCFHSAPETFQQQSVIPGVEFYLVVMKVFWFCYFPFWLLFGLSGCNTDESHPLFLPFPSVAPSTVVTCQQRDSLPLFRLSPWQLSEPPGKDAKTDVFTLVTSHDCEHPNVPQLHMQPSGTCICDELCQVVKRSMPSLSWPPRYAQPFDNTRFLTNIDSIAVLGKVVSFVCYCVTPLHT